MNIDNKDLNIKDFIKYFRNSIADSEKNKIELDRIDCKSKVLFCELSIGKVDEKIFKCLYEKKHAGKEVRKLMEYETIDVILIPTIYTVNSIHAEAIKSLPKEIIPFLVPAKMKSNGVLIANKEKSPWIPREFLEPSLSNVTVGQVDIMDKFLSKFKKPNKDIGWRSYWEYCCKMFSAVTAEEIEELYLENYTKLNSSYIILDKEIKGSRIHIMNLYDYLLTKKDVEINSLFYNFCSVRDNEKLKIKDGINLIEDSIRHYGQIGNKYPLSKSQREAIHCFNLCEEDEILAVNGPPGTGKTTLIHSVIAQMLVKAAVNEDSHPPIIVAASNNNQAVTNIIDSLGKIDSTEILLSKRWLPEVNSYGLYITSKDKTDENKKNNTEDYQTLDTSFNGLPKIMEDKEYLHKAEEYFISCFKEYSGSEKGTCIKDCIKDIHARLTSTIKQIEYTILSILDYDKFSNRLEKKYKDKNGIVNYRNEIVKEKELLKTNREMFINIYEEFEKFRKALPWYTKIFELIPMLKSKSELKNKFYFAKMNGNQVEFDNYSTEFIKSFIIERIEAINMRYKEIDNQLKVIELDLDKLIQIKSKALGYCKELNKNADENKDEYIKEDDIDKKNYIKIINTIDMKCRYEAFHLAVHYYEGKWIEEEKENIKENVKEKFELPVVKQKRRWERYAKVTPCFVSTFYMLPRFFSAWQGESEYLLNFIDLLIIDEAGQVSPEIAAASFTLSKKALVVGDMLQIEPVWSITETIDRANMKRCNLIKDINEECLFDYGLSSSSGNVMRIAQRASKYSKFEDVGGMYLTEHRRCVPEIINYCNELAYKGRLEPKRKNELINYPFKYMQHIHVDGHSQNVNTSWKNEEEAKTIVEWIVENKDTILSYYKDNKGNFPDLAQCIGIVTPFTVQANIIKRHLKKCNLAQITVGTVHKLQGAERNIVLFSTVYTHENTGNFFFDRNVNMLNVAVSRAKDSFIVFGDKKILDDNMDKRPSGLLAKYVFNNIN